MICVVTSTNKGHRQIKPKHADKITMPPKYANRRKSAKKKNLVPSSNQGGNIDRRAMSRLRRIIVDASYLIGDQRKTSTTSRTTRLNKQAVFLFRFESSQSVVV